MTLLNSSHILFDFSKDSDLSDWTIVNDGVMGGISQSDLTINANGNALFSGKVSLVYNGGFASVRYNPRTIDVKGYSKLVIRCKGPANTYQVLDLNSSPSLRSSPIRTKAPTMALDVPSLYLTDAVGVTSISTTLSIIDVVNDFEYRISSVSLLVRQVSLPVRHPTLVKSKSKI